MSATMTSFSEDIEKRIDNQVLSGLDTDDSSVWKPHTSWYLPIKGCIGYAFALLISPLVWLVVGFLALLVKLTSRGPAFYLQTRVGLGGKNYRVVKLRTMRHNCEALTGAQWCQENDPRITTLGRILRKLHLDELPQLWNVLRMEMALIGPRPERPEFVAELEKHLPHYSDRLLVRPGITGLAQVQLPPDTNLTSVRRKLAYDLYYVRHVNLWLDFRILLCTAYKVLGMPFHVSQRHFRIPAESHIQGTYQTEVGETGAALHPA